MRMKLFLFAAVLGWIVIANHRGGSVAEALDNAITQAIHPSEANDRRTDAVAEDRPDRTSRRAKIVVTTERGREVY